jgi:hypothetical protein
VKKRARIVRLFVASPTDTAVEKRIIQATIEDLNRTYGRDEGFRIDLYSKSGPKCVVNATIY